MSPIIRHIDCVRNTEIDKTCNNPLWKRVFTRVERRWKGPGFQLNY